MASQNVELVRRIFEAFNREGVEATAPFVADGLEAYPFPEWMDPGVQHGMEGLAALVAEWTDNFDDYRWDLDDVLDAPGDQVVILGHQHGRAVDQGVPVSQVVSAVFSFRDGRVFRMRYFLTWDEALAAGGLSPQA